MERFFPPTFQPFSEKIALEHFTSTVSARGHLKTVDSRNAPLSMNTNLVF